MKKLSGILGMVLVAGSMFAQNWTLTTVQVPSVFTCTNIINGPTRIYYIQWVKQSSTNAVDSAYRVFDAPRVQPYIGSTSGDYITNGIVFTNTGYYYYSQTCSNVNYNTSNPMFGINAFTNYAGVVTTITNSAALSNYCFTVSNNVAGVLMTNRLVLTGLARTNATTTLDFSAAGGLWFGKGLTISNGVAGSSGNGDTVVVAHDPVP